MPHIGEIDGRKTVFDAGPMVWRFVDTGEAVPLRSDVEAEPEEEAICAGVRLTGKRAAARWKMGRPTAINTRASPAPREPMPENVSEFRYSDFEYRQNEQGQGVISGSVINYGDVAKFPWGSEEFKAGAFGDIRRATRWVNRMHERSQPLGNTKAGQRDH